jgi:hypothetical protein
MKKLLCFPLLLLSLFAYAQEEDENTGKFRFGTYLGVLISYPGALDELNRQLRDAQRLDVPSQITGVSLGFSQRFADQNSYIAPRLSYFQATDMNDSEDHTRLSIWEFSVTSHYDLIPDKKWLAYPYLGLGLNHARLDLVLVTEADDFASSLQNIGQGAERERYVSHGVMSFIDIGLGAERALHFVDDVRVYLGVSGGYRLSFSEPWSIDGLRQFSGTNFSTQGWLLEIKLRSELVDPGRRSKKRGLIKHFQ